MQHFSISKIVSKLSVIFFFLAFQAPVFSNSFPPDCTLCEYGDVVGITSSEEIIVYDSVNWAVGSAMIDDLRNIMVCEGDYDEYVGIPRNVRDLVITACGKVTIRGFAVKKTVNVTIEGFVIDGGGIQVGYGHPYINKNLLIRNNIIKNAGYAGINIAEGNYNIFIENNTIRNNGNVGIGVEAGGPIYVWGNNIRRNTNHGIEIMPGAEIEIANNRIRHHGYFAVSLWYSNQSPELVTLIQNTFAYNNGYTVAGSHDRNLGQYDVMIDSSDDQPGY